MLNRFLLFSLVCLIFHQNTIRPGQKPYLSERSYQNNFSKQIAITLEQKNKVRIKQIPEENLIQIKIYDLDSQDFFDLGLEKSLHNVKIRDHQKNPFEQVTITSSKLKKNKPQYTKILLKTDPELIKVSANYIEQNRTIALNIISTKQALRFRNQIGQILTC